VASTLDLGGQTRRCARVAVQKCWFDPSLVSDFDSKLFIFGQLLEKCFQPRKELHTGLKYFRVEVGKLKQKRTEPAPQYAHRFYELLEFFVAFREAFFMCGFLWHFGCNDEALGRFVAPAFDRGNRRCTVENRIDFDCLKFRSVVRQVFRRFHSDRIERSFPTRCGKGGRSKKTGWHEISIVLRSLSKQSVGRSNAACFSA